MHRRSFLHRSAAGALAASLPVRAGAPAPRLRTALVGCGWWGGNILGEAVASGQCEVVGLCDVDTRQLAATRTKLAATTADRPREYKDYRELLAREKPEIVIVATPDHWHALPTIAAVKAGAHVYVEKPIGHTIAEGRAMLNAARAAGRVVQVGTHRRASPHTIAARDFIRSGKVGKIGMVRCFVNNAGSGPEKPAATQPVPPELDWDAWCGPAPLRPYSPSIHPRGFRQYLDYANGTLGDWGIHWFDQLIWITGLRWPKKVFGTGGRPIKGPPVLTATEQTSDAPDHQVVTYEFEGLTVTWESRLFAGHNVEKGENAGCHFYGTNGIFHLGWRGGCPRRPEHPRAVGGLPRRHPHRPPADLRPGGRSPRDQLLPPRRDRDAARPQLGLGRRTGTVRQRPGGQPPPWAGLPRGLGISELRWGCGSAVAAAVAADAPEIPAAAGKFLAKRNRVSVPIRGSSRGHISGVAGPKCRNKLHFRNVKSGLEVANFRS
jgi:predicted dehydrogenase